MVCLLTKVIFESPIDVMTAVYEDWRREQVVDLEATVH
jgi:hypothetical protein